MQVGVIGGSGFYKLEELESAKELKARYDSTLVLFQCLAKNGWFAVVRWGHSGVKPKWSLAPWVGLTLSS